MADPVVPDDFWAETDTETLRELLDTHRVFDTAEPALFVTTIQDELHRRGAAFRTPLFAVNNNRKDAA